MRRQLVAAAVAALSAGLYCMTGVGWFLSAAILSCAVLAMPRGGER